MTTRRAKPPRDGLVDAARGFLAALEVDQAGLEATPERVAEAWRVFTRGYAHSAREVFADKGRIPVICGQGQSNGRRKHISHGISPEDTVPIDCRIGQPTWKVHQSRFARYDPYSFPSKQYDSLPSCTTALQGRRSR